MKRAIEDVLEVEDFLTQQLDAKADEAAGSHMPSYSALFKGASNEIKRLRKLLIEDKLDES